MSQGKPRPAQSKRKGAKAKGPRYRFERIMAMEPKVIKETFPKGAENEPGTLWWTPAKAEKPAGTLYRRSLAELLSEKRSEKVRHLHANPGASGPRWAKDENGKLVPDPKDDGKHDYTERLDKAAKGEWVVDDDTLNDMAKENNNRFGVLHAEEQQRKKVRSLLGRLRTVAIAQTKAGEDPTPALEQAVADLEREQAS